MAMRFVRQTLQKASTLIRTRLQESSRPIQGELQPVLIRKQHHHPIHPAARFSQSKGRWYTTHSGITTTLRRFSTASGVKHNRSSFPKSKVGLAVTRSPAHAPFATALRPNLTGGALPRTAGGYALGGGRAGGVRYFSHTPASPAHVVHNVSAAVRAFWLSGQKAQYDGINSRTGEKRYRTVSALQEAAGEKMRSLPRATPGSFVEFQLSPMITAISPLSGTMSFETCETLNTDGLLDLLSVDFSRALRDLTAVANDLKHLSTLGDLPITLPDKSTLRVHFPGCDAFTVENLCAEVGVQRGIVHQDASFDDFAGTEMALLFPFAPTSALSIESNAPESLKPTKLQRRNEVDWAAMISSPAQTVSLDFSIISDSGLDEPLENVEANSWFSSPSGYTSISGGGMSSTRSSFEGLEGMYRFFEECGAV